MSSYVPSKIFKFVRPAMMKSVFEKCGVEFPDVDWERWGFKTSVLTDAWKEMKLRRDGGRGLAELDATLQDISDVGTAKTDVEAVIADMLTGKGMGTPSEFAGMNTWEKAVCSSWPMPAARCGASFSRPPRLGSAATPATGTSSRAQGLRP